MLRILKLGILFSVFFGLKSMPFNQDMVYLQPKTGEIMRDENQKSVPRGAMLRRVPAPEVSITLNNPYPVTDRSILLGKRLFLANCAQCHGVYLDSKYLPGGAQGFIVGLDLSTPQMALNPDGHFYGAIIHGFPQIGDVKVMGPYGHKFTDFEAWAIVHFIRDMQKKRQGEE